MVAQPHVTLLAQHGATLVQNWPGRFQKVDPTNGLVPFRATGDVAGVLAKYPPLSAPESQVQIKGFHRYAYVDQVGCFDDDGATQKALEAAELRLRENAAPGVQVRGGIGAEEVYGGVSVDNFAGYTYLGHVYTHWDPISRSVINRTAEDHRYKWGYVVRQAASVARSVHVTTLGEGINRPGDGWFEGKWQQVLKRDAWISRVPQK